MLISRTRTVKKLPTFTITENLQAQLQLLTERELKQVRTKHKSYAQFNDGWYTTLDQSKDFEILHVGRFDDSFHLIDDTVILCRQAGTVKKNLPLDEYRKKICNKTITTDELKQYYLLEQQAKLFQLHVIQKIPDMDQGSLEVLALIYEGQLTYYHTFTFKQLEDFVTYMNNVPIVERVAGEETIASLYSLSLRHELHSVSRYIYSGAITFLEFMRSLDGYSLIAPYNMCMSSTRICYPVCVRECHGCKIFRGHDGYVVYTREGYNQEWLDRFFRRVPFMRYRQQQFRLTKASVASEEFLNSITPDMLKSEETYQKLVHLVQSTHGIRYFEALGYLRISHHFLYDERSVARAFIFSGRPGLGKTYDALKIASTYGKSFDGEYRTSRRDVFNLSFGMNTRTYYDGYRGQNIVVLDDLGRYNTNEWQELVRLVNDADYLPPMAVAESKGQVPIVASEVYITTNKLESLLKMPEDLRDSICRRAELFEYNDNGTVTHKIYDMGDHNYVPFQILTREQLYVFFEEQVTSLRVLPNSDDSSSWLWSGLNLAVHFVRNRYGLNLRPLVDWLCAYKHNIQQYIVPLGVTSVVGLGMALLSWKFLKGYNGNKAARKRFKYTKQKLCNKYGLDPNNVDDVLLSTVQSQVDFESKFGFGKVKTPVKVDTQQDIFTAIYNKQRLFMPILEAQGNPSTERRKEQRRKSKEQDGVVKFISDVSSPRVVLSSDRMDCRDPLLSHVTKQLIARNIDIDEYIDLMRKNMLEELRGKCIKCQ